MLKLGQTKLRLDAVIAWGQFECQCNASGARQYVVLRLLLVLLFITAILPHNTKHFLQWWVVTKRNALREHLHRGALIFKDYAPAFLPALVL